MRYDTKVECMITDEYHRGVELLQNYRVRI